MFKKIKKNLEKFFNIAIAVAFLLFGLYWLVKFGIMPFFGDIDTDYKNYVVEGDYTFKYSHVVSSLENEGGSSGRSRTSETQTVRYYHPKYTGKVSGEECGYTLFRKKFKKEKDAESWAKQNPNCQVTAYVSQKKGNIYIISRGSSLEIVLDNRNTENLIHGIAGFLITIVGLIVVKDYFSKLFASIRRRREQQS